MSTPEFRGIQQAMAPVLSKFRSEITQNDALFQRIKSVADFNQALQNSIAAGKPVMLDFYADWCVSCKEMEVLTFADPAVQQALAGVVLLERHALQGLWWTFA